VNMPKHLLPTTVVGSYPQPEWLVDRAMLSKVVPRTRMHAMWRLPEPYLEEAQDDATIVAIRDMERAGIDVVTDGEIRRESYSNRFATALEGIDIDNPRDHCVAVGTGNTGARASSALSAAAVRSNCATWSFFAATPTAWPRSRCRVRSP